MRNLLLGLSVLFMGVVSHAQWGGGNIEARRQYCNSELCTYDLNWRVNGQNAVIVLEVQGGPESGVVKLFGCSGSYGNQGANWIRRDGARYIFHLYNSNRCTKDVGYYERPVDSVTIREGNNGGGGNGNGDNNKYGDIRNRRIQCYSDTCTHRMSWNVRGNSSVVTVVDHSTGREKLFACAGQTGNQDAPWIVKNGVGVEFRLYESSRCTQDVGQFERPVSRVIVREI